MFLFVIARVLFIFDVYSQCFVILNGTFSIDEQGQFNHGDFIKAPAGKYF